MIVWKHCRSMAHNLQSVIAVMVAVRWQLYRIASSPKTLAPDSVDKYLPSRETSTRPSAKIEEEKKKLKSESKQSFRGIDNYEKIVPWHSFRDGRFLVRYVTLLEDDKGISKNDIKILIKNIRVV